MICSITFVCLYFTFQSNPTFKYSFILCAYHMFYVEREK